MHSSRWKHKRQTPQLLQRTWAQVAPRAMLFAGPPEVGESHVDHSAAGYGCGRRDGQVVHLEEHAHLVLQLDALAVSEAERLVVVEHRVHRLDPDSVDRPVED